MRFFAWGAGGVASARIGQSHSLSVHFRLRLFRLEKRRRDGSFGSFGRFGGKRGDPIAMAMDSAEFAKKMIARADEFTGMMEDKVVP
jgi:hypothetical protein